MSELRVTHTSEVTEDQIDHLGHMNVRYYAVNASCGTRALLDELGWAGGSYSVDDVYTRHHREQLVGTPLEVRSGVLAADADEVRLHHELRASDSGTLAATFIHGVRARDDQGRHASFPGELVEAATAGVVPQPAHAAARTISLDADPLAVAPSIDTVLDRGLAIRRPRLVAADECHDDGSYRTELAPLLTWGGKPIEGAPGGVPHETSDGELMGWASMETRLVVSAWPRAGDRIQSFGAPIQVLDKVTHRIQWAFDLESGELLNAFEVVSMAFDIRARRPMAIPELFRRRELALLQPDLAPRTLV
ncbi:MAG: thioesterase family protein [Acidimicrobiales bacterium]|nr:thioesterase family protein [Acidimicrobiales bacterium]